MSHLATCRAVAWTLGLALVSGTASAQMGSAQDPHSIRGHAQRIPGVVRDAGIYHLDTGTWTRRGQGGVASFGPDIIYSNTASSGYFSSVGFAGGLAPGSVVIDEGALPTSLNTDYPAANRDSYNVDCVSFGYCDLGSQPTSSWELTFYSNYAPCTFDPTPDATLPLTGLPVNGCWTVSVSLAGGLQFCLAGDGGDLSEASPTRQFGWGARYTGAFGLNPAGLLLAGDPAATDPNFVPGGLPTDGTNTYYGPPSLCSSGSTGLYTQDFIWIEDPATSGTGCFFFGGYSNGAGCVSPFSPYSSFLIELQADTSICGTSPGPSEYCQSNPNSTGVNSGLEITGSASIAANNMVLTASVPPFSFGFFVTSPTQGFNMNPGGSAGNICLAGNIGRFVAPGQIKNSLNTGEISLSTLLGEWSITTLPGALGPYTAVAGMESNFQLWHRDSGPSGATSNFTDAYSVTWID